MNFFYAINKKPENIYYLDEKYIHISSNTCNFFLLT